MLLGRLAPEEVALEAEVAVVENVAEGCRDGTLSTLACWQKKKKTTNKKHRTQGAGEGSRMLAEPSQSRVLFTSPWLRR